MSLGTFWSVSRPWLRGEGGSQPDVRGGGGLRSDRHTKSFRRSLINGAGHRQTVILLKRTNSNSCCIIRNSVDRTRIVALRLQCLLDQFFDSSGVLWPTHARNIFIIARASQTFVWLSAFSRNLLRPRRIAFPYGKSRKPRATDLVLISFIRSQSMHRSHLKNVGQ